MALPALYIDNISLTRTNTQTMRGNTVSDISGKTVRGINIENTYNLRVKNNKVVRVRSPENTATGIRISVCNDCLLLYNTVSRTNTGLNLVNISTLNVYNLTVHLANQCIH